MGNGGPFVPADVGAPGTRPGIYINFIEAVTRLITPGVRGIVGIISEADWGPHNAVQVLDSYEEQVQVYGEIEDATSRLSNLIRLAFKGGANQVKAVRVMNTTNAVKATLTVDDTDGVGGTPVVRFDAKYFGTRGNNLEIEIADSPSDATKTRVRVYMEDVLVHEITSTVNHGAAGFIDNIIALFAAENSIYVDVVKLANGLNDLSNTAATPLAGGTNGDAVVSGGYSTAVELFNINKIHILTSDVVNSSMQTILAQWAKDRRGEGYRTMVFLGSDTNDNSATIITDAQSFNDEAVVYIGPGAIMPNMAGLTATYNGATLAALAAGVVAGLPLNRSATYAPLPETTGVETPFSNTQIKAMLAAGVLTITPTPQGSFPGSRIERGLTTLSSPGFGDIPSMKSIRTVRALDGIADGIKDLAADHFIGQQLNDENGREAVMDAIRDFLRGQEAARSIHPGSSVQLDTRQSNDDENLFLLIAVQPIEAVEFIWAEIQIN